MSELDFTLSLIDNITKPIRQVQSAVSTLPVIAKSHLAKLPWAEQVLPGLFGLLKVFLTRPLK
ncbi:hypothetical protein [Arsenophonus apicola]|uniref:hypothetical protein n=1 Tax=Arsenophonus apicola TaxID=2879119 RepID=UPI001CDD4E0B|nr:hypothetical protein [Arsenophonus apicola]UBX29532.1 hypothetical protein LDL57_02220 [Arsenophonus apicola]